MGRKGEAAFAAISFAAGLAVILVGLPEVRAAESASDADLKALRVWARATTEEFKFYRDREDDLLKVRVVPEEKIKGKLTRNLHADLQPDDDRMDRLDQAKKNPWAVDRCRVALRLFRQTSVAGQRAETINDTNYLYYAKKYLREARACEAGMKLSPPKNQFRDAIDVLTGPKS